MAAPDAAAIEFVPSPFLGRASAAPPAAAPTGARVISEGGAAVLFVGGEVFYNPVQVFNRDLSVMALRTWLALRAERATPRDVLRAYMARGLPSPAAVAAAAAAGGSLPPARIMEALSASGLRSLRYAAELPPGAVSVIVANDLEPTAAAAIRDNVTYNGDRASALVRPSAGDAILVMHCAARGLPLLPDMRLWMDEAAAVAAAAVAAHGSGGAGGGAGGSSSGSAPPPKPFLFDCVDLDPYGTASPFLDSALSAIAEGGLLAITCTDMAVLAGNHQDACRVKYGSVPVKGRHFGEQALRIVLACVEGAANRHKKTITPLASVCVDFYVRVFVTVSTSASGAAAASLRLSQLHQCTGCDSFWMWPLGKASSSQQRGVSWPREGQVGVGGGRVEAVGGAVGAFKEGAVAVEEHKDLMAEDEPLEGGASAAAAAKGVSASSAPLRGMRDSSLKGLSKQERKRRRVATAAAGGLGGCEGVGVTREVGSPGTAAASPHPPNPPSLHVVANSAPDLPCACPHCGRPVVIGGPVWSDRIHDPPFLARLLETATANFGEDGTGGGTVVAAAVAPEATVVVGGCAAAAGLSATSSDVPPPSANSESSIPQASLNPITDPCWVPRSAADAPSYYDLHARAQPRAPEDGGSNSVTTVAASRRRLLGVLRSLTEELPDAPLFVEASSLASRLRLSTVPLHDLYAAFINAGYAVSGSHAAPGTIKTDAPPAVWWAVMRALRDKQRGEGGGVGATALVPPLASTTLHVTASAAQPPRHTTAHATFISSHTLALAGMPLADALASPLSLVPTERELPPHLAAISFEWPDALRDRSRARAEERARGAGQRFVPNPGEGWGPRARATGAGKRALGE